MPFRDLFTRDKSRDKSRKNKVVSTQESRERALAQNGQNDTSTIAKGKNLGVRVLYEPPTGTVAVVDIVFVHGLTGNAYDTWLHEKSGIHWPSQLLEEDIKDARIMSFGYDADVVRWFSAASVNRVGNHAEALLGALARQRERTDSDDRKIIFVMHSLGGLVVQNALALSRSSREAHLQKIEANTVGLAFLGTPNFGSNLASWANYGTHLLNMVKRTNKDIVNVLEPDSEVLAIIQKRFHELLFMRQSQPIKISCFHEELPQGALGVIVGMESATLPPYPCYPIHASHSDMTKFQDRDCPGYNTVMGELWRWAKAVHNEASRNAASQAARPIITEERLRQIIDQTELQELLEILQVSDQDKNMREKKLIERENPRYYWIYRNIDFKKWESASDSVILWLGAPPDRKLEDLSHTIIEKTKVDAANTDQLVLCFFYSLSTGQQPAPTTFTHTLLNQIISASPLENRVGILRKFLHRLLDWMVLSRVDLPQHCAPRNEVENIRSLLESPPDVQLDALKRIIKEQKRERLLVVIDGLDAPGLSGKVQRGKEHRHRFFEQIKDFVNDLENYKAKVKALLTGEPVVDASSRTQHWICINYDEERTECLSSLLFDNSRYENISSGHEGSFEWIWTHAEFSDWLMASKSRLIYVQGKPGSGKSTLTKYVSESLLERENIAETAIVAKYFYSDREGESQRSHYHMLRSLLHDLLLQDENFFYSGFQKEYRNHLRPDSGMKRKYESLKRVLKSFKIYQASKPVYLIIDAVDESDQDDRRDILDLLLDLHEGPSERSTIKTFIASRPVGQLDSTSHNFIRLQDWTRGDICACAISFLDRLRLPDPTFYRSKALTFIVDRAQGVFLWVHLVGKDLLRNFDDGQSTQNVLEYLEELPQELDDYYKLMLQKICKNERNIADSRMLLQFVLFAKRPLTVDELLHALGARNTPDTGQLPLDAEFHLRVPTSKRILVCGGDFLEVKSNDERDICQVMHQTVRDYFFRPNSQAKQFILEKIDQDAHISIAMICIRYLTVVVANMNETKGLPPFSEWTDTQFAVCAQRLQQWPLASYALHHLADHINACNNDDRFTENMSRFLDLLAKEPAAYVLQEWQARFSRFLHDPSLTRYSTQPDPPSSRARKRIFHMAAHVGCPIASEIMLAAGQDINETETISVPSRVFRISRTALFRAAEEGHEAVVRTLLAYPELEVNSGLTNHFNDRYKSVAKTSPLEQAAYNEHASIVKRLLSHPNISKISKNAALLEVSKRGNVPIIKLLLRSVPKIALYEVEDINGRTPLAYAAENGHSDAVNFFLCHKKVTGAFHDIDKEGKTPLSYAAGSGHEDAVKLLLDDMHVNPNLRDRYGRTPISYAAERRHEGVVKLLVDDMHVNPNLRDNYGRTPILYAAGNGHEGVVKLLLDTERVDPNVREDTGQTPISYAAERGHLGVVQLLLDTEKVDIGLSSWLVGSPLDVARRYGHEDVVALLQSYGFR